ncbi:MAG: hypothetical protein EZS28_023349 [Streblomastix strix]|uniref:Uncharacterized protein n=1 Tax=Streblomastix strix TaxID=222440 RepID=A0A5J4VFE1_9EUKA|nr:MAG: hypothetical protein EZS28_023349 [Streblomastix strix]
MPLIESLMNLWMQTKELDKQLQKINKEEEEIIKDNEEGEEDDDDIGNDYDQYGNLKGKEGGKGDDNNAVYLQEEHQFQQRRDEIQKKYDEIRKQMEKELAVLNKMMQQKQKQFEESEKKREKEEEKKRIKDEKAEWKRKEKELKMKTKAMRNRQGYSTSTNSTLSVADKRQELEWKLSILPQCIPKSFYCQIVTVYILIVPFVIAFFVTSIVNISIAAQKIELLFITHYQNSIIHLIASLSLLTVQGQGLELDKVTQIPDTQATNPVWNDQSHLAKDTRIVRQLIQGNIQFFDAIYRKVKNGGKIGSDSFIVTGDSIIDSFSTTRAVKEGSKLNHLLMDSADCFQVYEGDCDKLNRVYGITGQFAGLEGLIQAEPDDPSVQYIITSLNYDLKGGLQLFLDKLLEQELQKSNVDQVTVIILFSFTISVIMITFYFGFLPSKDKLIEVAYRTMKISELDPQSKDIGDGIIEFNEKLVTKFPRIDSAHRRVLNMAREFVNFADRISEQSQEMNIFSKIITPKLKEVIIAIYASLNDEEYLMAHEHIPKSHINQHHDEHVFILKKISTSFSAAINIWIVEHICVIDQNLGQRLQGKASRSDSEKEIDLTKWQMPRSLTNYLEDDNSPLPDRFNFEQQMKMFDLKLLIFENNKLKQHKAVSIGQLIQNESYVKK